MLPPDLQRHTTGTELYNYINHPAFYPTKPPLDDIDLALRLYTNFIPANTDDDGWFAHTPTPIRLSRLNQDDVRLNILRKDTPTPATHLRYAHLPTNYYKTLALDDLNQELDRLWRNHRNNSPQKLVGHEKAIPDTVHTRIKKRTTSEPNWLYRFHSQYSESDLQNIDGVGPKTAAAIKHQASANRHHNTIVDTHSIIVCPNCDASWKAPYYPEMRHTTRTMSSVAYCPNCKHTTIPTSHISDPQPFTPTQPATQ